jgi:peptidoglycan/LPS O-acetylase OafA/YrhL
MAARPGKGYAPALTGLRALAATLVFVHHFFGQWYAGAQSPLRPWLIEAHIGVSVFFTLSGYLITRTYYDRFRAGELGFGSYWFKRFARVYPVFWFVLLARIALEPSTAGPPFQLAMNFSLAQAFFHSTLWTGLPQAWSLTIEECFYLLAPALYFGLRSLAPKRANRPSPWAAGVALFGACAAAWLIGKGLRGVLASTDFLSGEADLRHYSIFGRLPEFALGMMLGLFPPKPARSGTAASEALFLGGVGALVLTLVSLSYFARRDNTYYGIYAPEAPLVYLLAAFGSALIIASALKGSSLSRRILGNPLVEYLGRASYVFYLIQERHVAGVVQALLTKLGFAEDSFVPTFIVFWLVACGIYRFVEKPVHEGLLAWRQATSQKAKVRRTRGRAPRTA